MSTRIHCGVCGVEFCLPDAMYRARSDDGKDFYCPNVHCISYRPSAADKRIRELERKVDGYGQTIEYANRRVSEIHAQREEVIGVLKECPYQCGWRSRRQVARDATAMGRGIERVQADLREHLQEAHGARADVQRLLMERVQ